MARRAPRALLGLALLSLLAGPPVTAGAATAATPVPLPPEPGSRLLYGLAQAAVVADLDGDGSRELIRLLPRGGSSTELAVDVWRVSSAGSWVPAGPTAFRRKVGADEILSGGPRPDAEGMLPVQNGDPAWLLVVRVAGRDEVVAASAGSTGCCMTFWRVTNPADHVTLTLAGASGIGAQWLVAADMDADGTDELLMGGVGGFTNQAIGGAVNLRLYGWSGDRLSLLTSASLPLLPVVDPGGLPFDASTLSDLQAFELGDTDGSPGTEVGLTTGPSSTVGGSFLLRIALRGGVLGSEAAELAAGFGQTASRPLVNGSQIITGISPGGTYASHWPAGGPLTRDRDIDNSNVPLAFVGSPGNSLLAVRSSSDAGGPLTLYDQAGQPVATVDRADREAGFQGSGDFLAYAGPLPGGLADGRAAAWFSGQLVTASADGSPEVTDSALLAGMTPVGLMGPGGSWMVLARNSRFDATRRGGAVQGSSAPTQSLLSVAPTASVLSPEANHGLLQPLLTGALRPLGSGSDELVCPASGFSLQLLVPPSSRAFFARNATGFPAVPEGEVASPGGRVALQVTPQAEVPFSVRAFVLTPAGHSYSAAWHVRPLTKPPALAAVVDPLPWWFAVPLTGSTDPGAAVTVDGRPVTVDANGHFGGSVVAPPWPVTVRLAAIDLVGNQTVLTVSAVGLIDYRRLPWIPIVVFLTLVAGLALYLGGLHPPRPDPPGSVHQGIFEEIE